MSKLSPNNKFVPVKIQESMLKAISSVRERAKDYRKEKEKSLATMLSGDAKDMERVLSFAKTGKWQEAWNHAWRMDTAARDNIPDEMWNHIRVMVGEY